MRTRLVVNADDLGLHPVIDAGILRAHVEGIVTSATLLAAGPSAKDAVRAARAQKLPIGVHLALSTVAASSEQLPTLAPQGKLPSSWAVFARRWLSGRIHAVEVERELEAQLAKARALGATPDHLDSHQHLHLLPGIRARVEALAKREGLPLRWPAALPRPVRWREGPAAALKASLLWGLGALAGSGEKARRVHGIGVAESGRLTEPVLLALIESLPEGDVELGCHPGAGKPVVPEDPAWRYGWEEELAALCSPRVRSALEARGVTLCAYGAL